VLNGVGGRTIAEAKLRMTYVEAQQWFQYIRQNGPLNVARNLGRKLELGFALLSMVVSNSQGGKTKIEDFMPSKWAEAAVAEEEVSIEAVFGMLKGIARSNKGQKK
jgi:hypothetical protein